jgi:hypothetical protein
LKIVQYFETPSSETECLNGRRERGREREIKNENIKSKRSGGGGVGIPGRNDCRLSLSVSLEATVVDDYRSDLVLCRS